MKKLLKKKKKKKNILTIPFDFNLLKYNQYAEMSVKNAFVVTYWK